MGAIGTALTKVGVTAAVETAQELIAKLLGPAAAEAGLMLGEEVRSYRLRNQLRILDRAQEQLDRAGIDPHAVPLRTLVPLLEGASWEEPGVLSDLWSGLLASAANGDGPDVPPSYPEVLKQLAPIDADLLGRMFVDGASLKRESARVFPDVGWNGPAAEHAIFNLTRLGLVRFVRRRSEGHPDLQDSWGAWEPISVEGSLVVLTPFGTAFLEACIGPGATLDDGDSNESGG